jgi:multidrug resistance efflux pump
MVEMIIGTYGVVCWLVLVRFKLLPLNAYTILGSVAGGVGILTVLYILLSVFHPSSHDGRLYAPVVQIVPEVRGVVVEVVAEANKPLKKGDVLFRIDPRPYQIEVDRLRASLAAKQKDFAKLADELAAAEAATKQARANLTVSESANDRQLRETYERAKSQVIEAKERRDLAEAIFGRADELKKRSAGSEGEWDRSRAHFLAMNENYNQAQTDERLAAEKLATGSASLESTRQALAQAQATERKIRTEFNTKIDDQPPEVRETMALLDKARYDLDHTVVRAPTDGYVPQVQLRPGTMATATRLVPLMAFVVTEQPTLIASFQQKAIAEFKPGMPGEATFKQYPGRTFKVKIRRVMTAIPEGELDASGQLISPTAANEHGYIPVIFDYDEDISGLNLPIGSQATIAVYTERVHALSFLRKIIIRIHSWENYLF